MFESIFEFDAPSAPALAPAAPQPPPLQDSLSSRLGNNEDLIEEVLKQGDLRMLCQLKGVSQGWRARARRVLCERLFVAAKGRPVPTIPADVTDIDVEAFLEADGPGVAHMTEAMARFPNLARMHAHGFVVDVAAVGGLGPAPAFNGNRDAPNDVLQPVRGCIRGEGEPPGELLLAVRAARYGEAHVPERAFLKDDTLASIEVPAGLTHIGVDAFLDCSSLASIELPAGLKSIGGSTFARCSSLASIELPAGLTSIGGCAFYNCSSLASVELPAGLKSIGGGAFAGCASLASVELPAGLKSIGAGAFPSGCTLKRKHSCSKNRRFRTRAMLGKRKRDEGDGDRSA